MKSKSTKKYRRKTLAAQNQSVNVNVKNIIRNAPDMIQPRRYPGHNIEMGNQRRFINQPAMYGQPMPVFLPLQDRSAVQAPAAPQVSGPVIEKRPDLLAVETNPADIDPNKASIRYRPTAPVNAYNPYPLRSHSPQSELSDAESYVDYRQEAGHPMSFSSRYPAFKPITASDLERLNVGMRAIPSQPAPSNSYYTPGPVTLPSGREVVVED